MRGPRVTVHHLGHDGRVLAYHRWEAGGPRDDVIVLVNLSAAPFAEYRVGAPREGRRRVRYDSDRECRDPEFESLASLDADAITEPRDGMPRSIGVVPGPTPRSSFSQDE